MTKWIEVRRLRALAFMTLLVVGCGNPSPGVSEPPESTTTQSGPETATPEVSINAVMVSLVDHAAHNLWDVEREGQAPKTDDDWQNIVEHAVQIVAAGPAITVGGTGPSDPVWVRSSSWRNHAQRMSDAGVAAMNAAMGKNMDALLAANSSLVDSCESCHKEFKPTLPTEGIAHAHAH